MNKFNYIANSLTLLRIVIIVPLLISLSLERIDITLILLLTGMFTDLLDGYFARLSDYKSDWGARYDPLADKVLIIGPLLWLISNGPIPYWSVGFIIVRDLFISSLRSNSKSGKPANNFAKFKTFTLFFSILLILLSKTNSLNIDSSYLFSLGIHFYWISFIISMLSGLVYLLE